MANTFSVQQMYAAEVAAILEESCPFTMAINRSREAEFAKAPNGFKIGNSINVMIPGIGSVYDGVELAEGGTVEDWQEQSVSLSIDAQKHTALNVTADDSVFKLDATDPRRKDYRERVMKPQLSSLCAVIEADLLARAVRATPNLVGTPGSVPTTMKTFSQARGKLQKFLAPQSPRDFIISSDANIEMIDSSKALFNPVKDVTKQYREATIGRAAQADWAEAVNLPTITNGNKVAGLTVSGAGQSGSTLLIGGTLAGDTFKAGQVFTIAGVYAVHRLTGTAYTELQQFVITADVTATGATTTVAIYPAIKAAMPNKTVSALPAGAAALVFVGAASTGYRQNLHFQRDAFTAAFMAPPVVAGAVGHQFNANGLRFTVQTGGNFTNLSSATRIDIWYGMVAPRGIHSCRITE